MSLRYKLKFSLYILPFKIPSAKLLSPWYLINKSILQVFLLVTANSKEGNLVDKQRQFVQQYSKEFQ